MKKLFYILLILILIPLILLATAYFFLDDIVKYSINKYAPQAAGFPVSVSAVSLKPIQGHFEINGLKIGNPIEFAKEDLASLGKIAIDIDMKSLLTNKIVIKSVDIDKPVINFEMKSLTTNNIAAFLKNVNASEPERTEVAEEKAPVKKENKDSSATAKSFVLDLVNVRSGNVEAALNVAGKANSVAVPLPTITLTGIGNKKSESLSEVSLDVFKTILQKALQTVMSSGKIDLKQIANENMGGIVETVKEKVGLFGIFGKKKSEE